MGKILQILIIENRDLAHAQTFCTRVNGTSLFAQLKLLYANSVWITKNNVKANIWKLYVIFEANKEFMENLSLQ